MFIWRSYWFKAPFPTGLWTLTGDCRDGFKTATPDPDLLILLWNQADVQVYSELSTFSLVEGNDIGLQATLYNSKADPTRLRERRRPSPASQAQVWLANMHVITPKGQRLDVTMFDDGLHGDGAPNDGYYGALVQAAEVGTYQCQAILSGLTSDGIQYPISESLKRLLSIGLIVLSSCRFLRTSQHLLRVVPRNIEVLPTAVALPKEDGTIDIMLSIDYNDTEHSESYMAYAEVWGTASNGSLVPVSWIGGVVDVSGTAHHPIAD